MMTFLGATADIPDSPPPPTSSVINMVPHTPQQALTMTTIDIPPIILGQLVPGQPGITRISSLKIINFCIENIEIQNKFRLAVGSLSGIAYLFRRKVTGSTIQL